MLFAIGPPAIGATPTNTVNFTDIAQPTIDATSPLVALGGATFFADSETNTSGATFEAFSTATMYTGSPALVPKNGTGNQAVTTQKLFPATNAKRGVRAEDKQARSNRHPEGRHRLTATRLDVSQNTDVGVPLNPGQIIQI